MTTLTAVRSQHAHDTYLSCHTCAPARGSRATFRIEFDDSRWLVCGRCLPTCLVAAWEQFTFTPPFVALVNKSVAVAA